MHCQNRHRGVTIVELMAAACAAILLVAMVAPMLAGARGSSRIDVSISNLRILGAAHQTYAADWDGRQFTLVVDELAQYGSVGGYEGTVGETHPPILLGKACLPDGTSCGMWGYYFGTPFNYSLVWPINPTTRFGWARIPNAKGFHDYVNGKFYDPTFYAPNDGPAMTVVEPLFDLPDEFVVTKPPGSIYWSSYWLSPAALFGARTLTRTDPLLASGTFSSPGQMPSTAFRAPGLAEAAFANLKTHMIEHNWNQNPPAPCNPAVPLGTYDGCEPYYYNSGVDSVPVALFYDGHVRLLPNREVLAANEQVRRQSASVGGLWLSPGDSGFDEAGTLSLDGYFTSAGYDGIDIGYHVLTANGIRGRDTLGE